jgi:hypothetical protein
VQKWLEIIGGGYAPRTVEHLKTGTRPPFPYSDVRLLPYLQHSFWFLPNVAACHAMANLLAEDDLAMWLVEQHARLALERAQHAVVLDRGALSSPARAGRCLTTRTSSMR